MKPDNSQRLRWELTRERFGIEDRYPPPERRQEKHIRDILSGILKAEKNEAEEMALPEILASHWPVIAGEQLSKHVRPSHLKSGFLYLQADHPGWLAELRRLPKTRLLKKITSLPGIPKIKDIRYQLDPAIRIRK
jgi:predicted nucleic acid-binding Zn ribbon protein